ncbi:MFS transporter [Chitinophaga pendula]|uniref:MFS transporter n=1 Tax=Chitinophaga TaxID=79328 RepID=UPI000BB088F5|nr:MULTISPECIES: MFS transporter [Chitinophaga]ASZ09684.1 MFS transporter [Chitinophaga sp. MD30]UCJ07376.1 MFS transporter [Chitinophaga pendula]
MFSLTIDMKRSYRIATCIFFFIAGLTYSSWACRIHDIKAQFGFNNAELGSILFSLPVGLMISLPISGWMVTKVGSRKVLIAAGLLFPFMLCMIGLATQVWQLVIVLFLFGFLNNVFEIAMNTQAVGIEGLYKRSIMASFHGLWSLAGFAGVAIGTLAIGLEWPVWIHFLLIGVLCWLLVTLSWKNLLPEDAPSDSQPLFAKPDSHILKLGIIAFASLVTEGTMFDWSGIYFQKVVAVPEAYTTLGYIAFMGTMAGGRFVSDSMVTRFGIKRVLQCSGIISTCGLLLAILLPHIITATLGFLLVGIGVSSIVPLVLALAGKSKTLPPGVAIAAVSTVGFLGFLIGPPLIGFIAEATDLRWSFALIAVLGLGTTLLASRVKSSE